MLNWHRSFWHCLSGSLTIFDSFTYFLMENETFHLIIMQWHGTESTSRSIYFNLIKWPNTRFFRYYRHTSSNLLEVFSVCVSFCGRSFFIENSISFQNMHRFVLFRFYSNICWNHFPLFRRIRIFFLHPNRHLWMCLWFFDDIFERQSVKKNRFFN